MRAEKKILNGISRELTSLPEWCYLCDITTDLDGNIFYRCLPDLPEARKPFRTGLAAHYISGFSRPFLSTRTKAYTLHEPIYTDLHKKNKGDKRARKGRRPDHVFGAGPEHVKGGRPARETGAAGGIKGERKIHVARREETSYRHRRMFSSARIGISSI